VDASLVPAPKQRNTDPEKEAIKAGKSAREIWPDEPNKAAQKDANARWTLKIGGKVRYSPEGSPLPMIAAPIFGYKSHISIDRRFGFIRESMVTSASEADGRQLRHIVSTENTGSEVWADTAYRSRSNEKWLAKRLLISRIHRCKPTGKQMPKATARANAKKSSIRARVEHVFSHQKNRFGLFIRTIGLARAEAKLTLANLAYNFDRPRALHCRGQVAGKGQPPRLDVLGHQRVETRFIDRHFSLLEPLDLVCIFVDAHNVVPEIGKTHAGDQADIARANHGNFHVK